MEKFLKEYVYFELSSKMYQWKGGNMAVEAWDDNWVEIDEGESGIRANVMGVYLDWTFSGRYKARRELPRSKYRRLCKRVYKRFRKLLRRYKYE